MPSTKSFSSSAAIIPTSLPRPTHWADISLQAIKACDASLVDVPPHFIRKMLAESGNGLFASLASTTIPALQGSMAKLPLELQLVSDMSATLPTHVLGVYTKSAVGTCRVSLFPTHSLVLAAHCLNLPVFVAGVSSSEEGPDVVPVVPLNLPSAATFSLLHHYLYTKRSDLLFAALVAELPSATGPLSVLTNTQGQTEKPTLLDLQPSIERILGVWRNATALGVVDDGIWDVIDAAWKKVVECAGQLGYGTRSASKVGCVSTRIAKELTRAKFERKLSGMC